MVHISLFALECLFQLMFGVVAPGAGRDDMHSQVRISRSSLQQLLSQHQLDLDCSSVTGIAVSGDASSNSDGASCAAGVAV